MNSETLKIIAERYLGSAKCEDYVEWARACLAANVDSKSMRILASLQKPLYSSEVDDYFYRSLNELGWTMPEEQECLFQYARQVAQQILSNDLPPLEGCRKIYRIADALVYPDDLIAWFYLDEGLDPSGLSDLQGESWDEAIRSEAERLLKESALFELDDSTR